MNYSVFHRSYDSKEKQGAQAEQTPWLLGPEVPERILAEVLRLTGQPSLSQVTEGRGIPEASQLRDTGLFSTTLMFSAVPWFPIKLGGAAREKQTGRQ